MADGMAMTTMLLLCPMTTIGSISYFASLGISRLENYVACVAFLSRWVGTSCPRMTSPTINILLCLEYKDPPLLTGTPPIAELDRKCFDATLLAGI